MPRFDEDLTPQQWAAWEAANDAEDEARDEAFDRFREDAEEFLDDCRLADDHSSDVDQREER